MSGVHDPVYDPTRYAVAGTILVNSVPTNICYVGIYMDGSLLTQFGVDNGASPIFFSHVPPPGTHTYQVKFHNSTQSGVSTRCMLQALEFRR